MEDVEFHQLEGFWNREAVLWVENLANYCYIRKIKTMKSDKFLSDLEKLNPLIEGWQAAQQAGDAARASELAQQVRDGLDLVHQAMADLAQTKRPDLKFSVYVDDNYHFMDEDERYTLGQFDTEDEAIQLAQKIVDGFLIGAYKPGMSADELLSAWLQYGEGPSISLSSFSAKRYAEQRCQVLCNSQPSKKP